MRGSISDNAYARCIACDTRYYPEWNKKLQEYETLCNECRRVAMWAAKVDPVVFMETGDEWVLDTPDPLETDKEVVHAYTSGHLPDDLWKEDEYLEYGEGAFGNPGLFDR